MQSPTLTSSSQTQPIRPKRKMGPRSRIRETLKKSQTPPIRPKMGPKSRIGVGPKIQLDTDTVEDMEVDADVSIIF